MAVPESKRARPWLRGSLGVHDRTVLRAAAAGVGVVSNRTRRRRRGDPRSLFLHRFFRNGSSARMSWILPPALLVAGVVVLWPLASVVRPPMSSPRLVLLGRRPRERGQITA